MHLLLLTYLFIYLYTYIFSYLSYLWESYAFWLYSCNVFNCISICLSIYLSIYLYIYIYIYICIYAYMHIYIYIYDIYIYTYMIYIYIYIYKCNMSSINWFYEERKKRQVEILQRKILKHLVLPVLSLIFPLYNYLYQVISNSWSLPVIEVSL